MLLPPQPCCIRHHAQVCHVLLTLSYQAYIAVQNLVPTPQIPIAMAIVIFTQNMGGAVWLVAANSIFSNGLRQQLQNRFAEIGVDPDLVLSAGVNGIREFVQGDRLAAALECYTEAISHVMYLGVGVSIATFCFAWGLGWKDIRVEKKLQAIKSETSKPGSLPDSEDSAPEKPTVT